MPRLPFGDAGPAQLIWHYGESGEIVLNPYRGDVIIRGSEELFSIQEEEYGNADVDAITQGLVVEIDAPLTRSTLAQLEAVLRGSLAGNVLTVSTNSGCPQYENAHPLLFKPICNNVPDSDSASWILFFKTFPFVKFEWSFGRASQRITMVGFKVFVSQESGQVGDIFQIGVAP